MISHTKGEYIRGTTFFMGAFSIKFFVSFQSSSMFLPTYLKSPLTLTRREQLLNNSPFRLQSYLLLPFPETALQPKNSPLCQDSKHTPLFLNLFLFCYQKSVT